MTIDPGTEGAAPRGGVLCVTSPSAVAERADVELVVDTSTTDRHPMRTRHPLGRPIGFVPGPPAHRRRPLGFRTTPTALTPVSGPSADED